MKYNKTVSNGKCQLYLLDSTNVDYSMKTNESSCVSITPQTKHDFSMF